MTLINIIIKIWEAYVDHLGFFTCALTFVIWWRRKLWKIWKSGKQNEKRKWR